MARPAGEVKIYGKGLTPKVLYGRRIIVVCKFCGETYKVIPSRVIKTKFCSQKCCLLNNIGPKGYWLGKKRPDLINTNAIKTMFTSESVSGPKSNHWMGGISKLHKTERQLDMLTTEYKKWRKAVFERDNYTCQICEKRGNGVLQADHIKPYRLYPELRYELFNGRTLCVQCHQNTPTYSRKTAVAEEVVFHV